MSVVAGVSDDMVRGKIGLVRVRRHRRMTLATTPPVLPPCWRMQHSCARTLPPGVWPPPCPESQTREQPLRGDDHCQAAEVVSATEDQEESELREAAAVEEDEEAQEERRRRIRERCLLREREEEELLPKEDDERAAAESESEADSEEEEVQEGTCCIPVVKPMFVPRPLRQGTVVERERIEDGRRRLEELVNRSMEERKVDTRQIVVELIVKDDQIEKTQNEEPDADIDTDDEADEAMEYEVWRNRETERIKRGIKEARLRLEGRSQEIERLSNMAMTEEHMERDRRNPALLARPEKRLKLMQRYAFFQEKN
ncbi:hypothetical protein U9M48_027865 [Paspalum notatum var. saurae]|uniref:Micro-fibrillar-associated protein 1 C-terminal domain-containing protein n=1 Tax=Paspalum notatum var. saurae TaxID=547442 RepID=A0AAQ3TZR0_PASNO